MTVLKDKMLVRFQFTDNGQTVESETEFFNYEWGRLRDICISDDGRIYLATNGNTWPSQPPNEIIELSNTSYYVGLDKPIENNAKYVMNHIDVLGHTIDLSVYKGFYFTIYSNGSVEKNFIY